MQRIIVHWTAGSNNSSANDRKHYHILIEGDGHLTRGTRTIADNMSAADGVYAAHTLNCNTQSIGVTLCGMLGAVERPFNPGTQPINSRQFNEVLPAVLAQLCRFYKIPVTPHTVLSHAEVQGTLGIKQKGKWDIAALPWDSSMRDAKKIGDRFRKLTSSFLIP